MTDNSNERSGRGLFGGMFDGKNNEFAGIDGANGKKGLNLSGFLGGTKDLLSRIPRKWLLTSGMLLAFSGVAAIVPFVFLRGSGDALPGSVPLTRDDAPAVPGGPGTPEYNALVEEENRTRAEAARASGDSHVPVPAGAGASARAPAASPGPLVRGNNPVPGPKTRAATGNAATAAKKTPTPRETPAKAVEMPASTKETPKNQKERAGSPSPEDKETKSILSELRNVRDRLAKTSSPVSIRPLPKSVPPAWGGPGAAAPAPRPSPANKARGLSPRAIL
ncbi:MAG: hypothetical protein LBF41_07970 [Deltaproteobacteria bacterium]|jgi:hypothetical protein|nr:hypothetical protein [Deltaproteobacteria bacterium]